MDRKKQCVAMLLAGGQGSRLYALTNKVAKPAVHFGSKYRIIDFTLSNCVNSGIDTVGVLTQYQPLELNDYIGNGEPWDLDRTYGGVHTLPPYQRSKGGDWYKGTANAIYQNLSFIQRYNTDYVLILSGDHIYKMDYNEMLKYHREKNADCTIAVINVPMAEASRFGIMNTRDDGSIYDFEEKPKEPKSNKASMGVYIFNREVLFDYLMADEKDPNSKNDFGKNVIPALLRDGKRLFAYEFDGYWKDVGTVASLWESNMDLLGENPKLNLRDSRWKIYYRHVPEKPHYVGEGANIINSIIAEGCEINGTVENSVIFSGVSIGAGAVVRNSVVMNECRISDGAQVDFSILDTFVMVGEYAVIGLPMEKTKKITVIASEITIGGCARVKAGDMVTEDVAAIDVESG